MSRDGGLHVISWSSVVSDDMLMTGVSDRLTHNNNTGHGMISDGTFLPCRRRTRITICGVEEAGRNTSGEQARMLTAGFSGEDAQVASGVFEASLITKSMLYDNSLHTAAKIDLPGLIENRFSIYPCDSDVLIRRDCILGID
jgi:hypothetical protein